MSAINMLDTSSYALLFCICFATISLFHFIFKQLQKPHVKHPPTPPALPIIGHLHLLGPALSKSFQNLASRYGPIMRLRIGTTSSVIVSNANIAKEFLKNNEMNFVSRLDEITASSYNLYGAYTFVFAEYGEYWRFMKKLCMTELLSVSQVNRFADIRREERLKLMGFLVKCSEENKASDLGQLMLTMSNDTICRMAMSTRCTGTADQSNQILSFVKGFDELTFKFSTGEILGPLKKLDLFGYGKKLKALFLEFDSFIEKIIVEHEKELDSGKQGRKDILDILLETFRDGKADLQLTRTHVKSFLLEIFMAGTDTTNVVLQWIMAELINSPRVFKKLREEIDTAVGSKRLVEESDIPNLPYLQAVVKEGLRLHPSAPIIFRRCGKDCKINGYDILANERIVFNLNAIMRDPNSWENPLDFVPERFTFKSGEYDHFQMDFKGQNFMNFPFGSGRRGCPGASLALAVIHGTVATLVQCFDFKVYGGEKLNMLEGSGIASRMAHPLLCYPMPRFNPLPATC